MGILDDAIREHLELKRRHGVTEDELQRQEEEALGPARRDVAQQHEEADPAAAGQDAALFDGEEPATSSGEPAPVEEHPSAVDEPPSLADESPSLDEEPPVAGQPPVGQAPEIGSRAPDHELDSAQHEPEPATELEEELDEELETALEEDLAEDREEPEDELVESDLEDEDGDNDVLEDTPDFLQETPEHDRLWFEQKPPRDFDFD